MNDTLPETATAYRLSKLPSFCVYYKTHTLKHSHTNINSKKCFRKCVYKRLQCCIYLCGCSGLVVEYRSRNREVTGSTHTRSTASNLEQVANLLYAQANSATYPQRDGK